MATSVVMPQLGESVVEGVVVKWRVKEGDVVKADQAIAEVETDKATTELPSPAAGRVVKLLAKEGDTVAVGKAILELDDSAGASAAPAKPASAAPTKAAAPDHDTESSAPVQVPISAPLVLKAPLGQRASSNASAAAARHDDARISPVVRKMAAEFNLDLSRITGTGDGGRITKKDVQSFLDQGPAAAPAPAVLPSGAAPRAPASVPVHVGDGDQLIPFSRRRKIIAERLSLSRRTIPEVTTFAEVDMAKVAQIRARYKAQIGRAHV